MNNFKLVGVTVFVLLANCLTAQPPKKIHEFIELARIENKYEHIHQLNFDCKISYSDSSKPKKLLDSNTRKYYLHDGNKIIVGPDILTYYAAGGLSIRINKIDSTVTINNHKARPILQLPFMDSIFRAGHIQSMTSKELNDSVRQLFISFKPGSYYRSYSIKYLKKEYIIKEIKYYTRPDFNYQIDKKGLLSITLSFLAYNANPPAPGLFDERSYILPDEKKWKLAEPYKAYKFRNDINHE